MAIALNSDTERRLAEEMAKGQYPGPSELIDHALDLVASERETRRHAIAARLEESLRQAERGETYSAEEAKKILAERRAARMAG